MARRSRPYRVSGTSELAELGFEDLPPGAVTLLEWPDRAAGFLPPNRLDIEIEIDGESRRVRLNPHGAWEERAIAL